MCFCSILVIHNNGIFLSIFSLAVLEQFTPTVALDIESELQFLDILAGTDLVGVLTHDGFGVFGAGFDNKLKFNAFGKTIVDDEGRMELVYIVFCYGFVANEENCKFVLFLFV